MINTQITNNLSAEYMFILWDELAIGWMEYISRTISHYLTTVSQYVYRTIRRHQCSPGSIFIDHRVG